MEIDFKTLLILVVLDQGAQTCCTKTRLFSRVKFLDRSSLSDRSRLYLWGRPKLKALHSSRVFRSISGKFPLCLPKTPSKHKEDILPYPMVKQKEFGTRPQGQIPKEKRRVRHRDLLLFPTHFHSINIQPVTYGNFRCAESHPEH